MLSPGARSIFPPQQCQLSGILYKKSSASQSNRWSRRFFVLKDGYLLYYPESERKEFESKGSLNLHPKGVLPLGDSSSSAVSEQSHPFSFKITRTSGQEDVVMAAESEYERDRWLGHIEVAARITHQNASLGDAMIERLESEGLKMAHERQQTYEKLQSETAALECEKERNEELRRQTEELEAQKQELLQLAEGLRTELDSIKGELDETSAALQAVEEERESLRLISSTLQENLKDLEKERHDTEAALAVASSELKQQSAESSSVKQLRETLEQIERRTSLIQEEKSYAQTKLQEAENLAQQLKSEKADIMQQAQQLQSSIKELGEEKSRAERELREEARRRQDAEEKLAAARRALDSLQNSVTDAAPSMDEDTNNQMVADVKQLTNFFENMAVESLYESKKQSLMKTAMSACRTGTLLSRSRTIRMEAHRKRTPLRASAAFQEQDFNTLPVRFRKEKKK